MFNTNRAFLGLLHRSFLTKPALTLIFIASVSLSLASGYTTWDGMTEFTSSAGLSFLMTAGLQGLMLVLAWVIGKELVEDKLHKQSLAALKFKDRTRAEKVQRHFSFFLWRHKGIILSFVLCMAVSVFFSFDSFFRNIFTETQRGLASTVVARTEVQIISGEVETALARASTRARSELIKSPQWTDLKKRLTSLTENTEKIEGLVALSQAEKTRELAGTSAALQSAIRLKTIDLERSKAEEQKLATTQTDDVERVKLRTLIAGLRGQQQEQQKIVDARIAKIEDEIKTGQGKRARGCGPVCRSLKSELVQDEQKLEEIKSKLRQAVNQETEINNLASNVNTAVLAVRSELRATETALGTLKAELEQVAGKRNNKKDAVNFEDRVKNLTSAVALFELNSDQKSLGNVRQSCLNIVDRIKSLNIPGQIQGSQGCEVSDVAAKVVAANFDERIKRTQAACRADLSKMTFDDVFAYGRNCLSVANLGKSLTAGYQRQLDKIALEYSAQAHPFERNVNAITSYNKLAILAAALAVLIDFLVFLTGIFGARHAVGILASAARPRPYDKENAVRWALGSSTTLVGDEDEETLKAKVFLSFLEPMAEIKDGFMCQIRLDRVAPPYLEIVNSELNSGPYFERADEEGVFLVSDTMYRHLTKTVYDFEEYRKYFRGSAASASTARYATLTHSPHAATAQHSPSELDIVRAIKNATNSPNRAYTREK